MKKNSLFNYKKKSKKDISNDKERKIIFNLKGFYKKIKKEVIEYSKNNKDEINSIKKFFLIISGYGFIINYSLHFLIGVSFNLFTLFSWGIVYYFISDEFVEWFRRLKR